MQTENWADFQAELRSLAEAYDRKYTTELEDAYWKGLGKMSMRDFKIAAQFAREKAGTEDYKRLPMPGRFWSMRDVAKRHDEPSDTQQRQLSHAMPRDEHLRILRRIAIQCAKNETMPKFKGFIIGRDYIPPAHHAEFTAKWERWDREYGTKHDDFWWPRARELMIQWGEKCPDEALLEAA